MEQGIGRLHIPGLGQGLGKVQLNTRLLGVQEQRSLQSLNRFAFFVGEQQILPQARVIAGLFEALGFMGFEIRQLLVPLSGRLR